MRSILVVPMLLGAASCARPELEVENAWVRASAGQTTTAAVFMTIKSPVEDRLVSGSTEVAAKTDLMTMESAGGAMSMRYVQGIDLPANAPVSLDPSGLHVWLEGLRQPLRAGHSFPLTLEFEKAGTRRVTVQVIATASPTSH